MSRPTLLVECAFASDPTSASQTWTDISSKVLGLSIRRGRQYELDTMQSSTLSLRLDNASRDFDPTYTHGRFYPNVLPGRKIRVSAVWAGVTYRLFTGFVERWPVVWDSPRWQSVSVEASDGFQALQQAALVMTGNLATAASIDAGFDSGTTGWTVSNGTLSQVTTGQQNGAGAGKMFGNAGLTPSAAIPGTSGTLSLGLVAGNWYEFSCWIYVPSGLGITAADVGMYFRQDGVATIGATGATAFDTWQQHGFTMAVAPSSTQAWIEIRLAETGAAKFILIDGFHAAATASRGDPALGALVGTTTTSADGTTTPAGTRIGECLNASNWLTTDRLLDTGRATLPAAAFAAADDQAVLSHIQEVAAAEPGLFFIDGQGRAVFQDRTHRYNTTSVLTLTDAAGGIGTNTIPYTDATPDYDVGKILNDVTATINGGTAQNVTDTTSQTRFFRRSSSISPLLTTDSDARQLAGFQVALHKNPKLRFQSVTVKPLATDYAWPPVLAREISDKVTVTRTPDSIAAIVSETITQRCFIEGVQHDVTPSDWVTTYQLSPADLYEQFLILGTGQLDSATNGLLAL